MDANNWYFSNMWNITWRFICITHVNALNHVSDQNEGYCTIWEHGDTTNGGE